ncbi:histone-lysine N-methyltransferase SETMAR-like [Contarinia nasturtii]|uniref:histone-lysine N-methyltransferase SETMAR-like n=1 Tax=Contarinia nasturtii TaxID=265458 RepID=UPI0012D3FB38|nr:histone-lysine N-methyltransferase SETMAR-like [Contarinia nasturtii]
MEGRETFEDKPRSGRPSTSVTEKKVEKVKKIVLSNRRVGIGDIAEELNISYGSVQHILVDLLNMTRVAARLVPEELTFEQKERRVAVAKEMLGNVSEDPNFIKRIITGDETWIYEYDVETSQQSSVESESVADEGQTVKKEYYLAGLKRLREKIRLKRRELWTENSWILHHDNAPSHTALVVCEFLAKNQTKVIAQAPYSPDMAPCDFFLFSRLKLPLRGKHLDTIENIKQKSKKALSEISAPAYAKCMDEWIKRWEACVNSNGSYFEGDNKDLH